MRARLYARGDEFEIHVSHHVSRMYPACILITLAGISHVSRMYPASQIRTSQDTFEIHVSQNVSWKYPACILACIPHVSSNHSSDTFIPHVSLINLACIMYVFCMYPRTSADTCIPHGSRMYPECILYVS